MRLRNADKWVALLDKGRMTSLDHPEVRALASRYGNPDDVLAEDWIPEVPGINAPGDYLKDYAPNPGQVLDQGAGKGEQRHLRALLPEGPGAEDDERHAAGDRQAGREIGSRIGQLPTPKALTLGVGTFDDGRPLLASPPNFQENSSFAHHDAEG